MLRRGLASLRLAQFAPLRPLRPHLPALATLLPRIHKLLADAKLKPMPAPAEVALRLDEDDDADEASGEACEVEQVEPGAWRVTGAKIEKAASMTNWDYYEAQERFQRIMKALGASEKLSRPRLRSASGIRMEVRQVSVDTACESRSDRATPRATTS